MFASGKNATVSAKSEPGARGALRRARTPSDGQAGRPVLGVERQRRGDPAGREAGQAAGQQPLGHELGSSSATAAAAASSSGAGVSAASGARRPAARRTAGAAGPRRARRRRSRGRAAAGRAAATRAAARPPGCAASLAQVAAPERMLAGERLPEQHADRPDVGRRGRRLAVQPLGRDVRERAGNVAERRSACRTRPSARARSRAAARRSSRTRRAGRSTA